MSALPPWAAADSGRRKSTRVSKKRHATPKHATLAVWRLFGRVRKSIGRSPGVRGLYDHCSMREMWSNKVRRSRPLRQLRGFADVY